MLWHEFREPVVERFAAAGLPEPGLLTGRGLEADPAKWPFVRDRSKLLATAPFISVVICTRDRVDELETCLQSVEYLEYPRFEVIVVDNAPTGDDVRALVEARVSKATYRYVVESLPGLSRARNTGVAAATGDIIAFLDDDDVPDKHWLTGIARGFAWKEEVGCVAGPILPARLDTLAQEIFEQIGGHRKGRGFVRSFFSRSGPQKPLFPLPPFGTGANMAFRREILSTIGGFDVALGAGTCAAAGEDTLALTLTLLYGYEIVYEPTALMWHHHRRDIDSLCKQLHGYSIGLTAFYTALLKHRPRALLGLIGLVPTAARYLLTTPGADTADSWSHEVAVDRRHLQGLLAGPLAYVRAMRSQRRSISATQPTEDR
jgi:GT2 family glycosyltransferase